MPVTSKKILALLNVDDNFARAPYGQGIKPRPSRESNDAAVSAHRQENPT